MVVASEVLLVFRSLTAPCRLLTACGVLGQQRRLLRCLLLRLGCRRLGRRRRLLCLLQLLVAIAQLLLQLLNLRLHVFAQRFNLALH